MVRAGAGVPGSSRRGATYHVTAASPPAPPFRSDPNMAPVSSSELLLSVTQFHVFVSFLCGFSGLFHLPYRINSCVVRFCIKNVIFILRCMRFHSSLRARAPFVFSLTRDSIEK